MLNPKSSYNKYQSYKLNKLKLCRKLRLQKVHLNDHYLLTHVFDKAKA